MSIDSIGLALKMVGVGKRYPATIAVDNVDFEVYAGEVHALVGENGAGKTTLMKMLAGSFNDYTGAIFINDKMVRLSSPSIAKSYGIGMIYQELSLAQPISIAENLLVGRLPRKGLFIDREKMVREAKRLLKTVGLDLDPLLPIEDISQHEAQLVEIAKVLGTNPCILVMDEPTSALSREEVDRLFAIIAKLRNRGMAIVYISHHLPEVFQVADRVTVMRDAKKVATKNIDEVTREEIVHMMVGKSIKELYKREERQMGKLRLEVKGLSRYGFFHNIDIRLHEGEILGICGLSGAGRSELAQVICGVEQADEGSVVLDGEPLDGLSMAKRVVRGLGYLTEDRKLEGLALRLAMDDNILSSVIPQLKQGVVYNKKTGWPKAEKLIKELSIYPSDLDRTAGNLSGGNQQKLLLAKWMAINPKVLILDEPSRGVDVGAKMTIHETIERLAREGSSILIISSDLPELVRLADRVIIMRKGHFTKIMEQDECSEESLLLAANTEMIV
ncbi:MAG: sugar ABC transporter ATP-binding protein [Sphaerochaeta sp.]|nr:sugar ABC transporter ATP-binding protein [Sphaerochaeta sp.]